MQNAEEILGYLIDLLTEYLTDLSDTHDTPAEQFNYGEKLAYTECLEIISCWEKAKQYGLIFDVEERFPI